jgi:BCD family chlorophyll transporter-like MFS transporter
VAAAGTASKLLDPFSPERLLAVATGVVLTAQLVTMFAVWGVEGAPVKEQARASAPFGEALRGIWDDRLTRLFSIFVFFSMLAYSMQDLILEPFAGLVFGLTPGQSTGLSGQQNAGVLVGMILVGAGGHAFGGQMGLKLKPWIIGGCLLSALALAGLAHAAVAGPGWPLTINVVALGFANGMFAVAAIGAMLQLAGRGGAGHEGIRMGLWGAAQAAAFGLGGLLGAVAVDAGRRLIGNDGAAFQLVFCGEAVMFVVAAIIAMRLNENMAGRPMERELLA